MKARYFIPFIWLFCSGCSFKHRKPLLRNVQVIDHNGISQTISDPKRLLLFETKEPIESHPYKQITRNYKRTKKGDLITILTSYYANGNVLQYLEVVNGRSCGKYKEWHQNGMLHLECQVGGGVPDLHPHSQKTWEFDGSCYSWDKEGNLEAKILYNKGKREGESFEYYSSGNVQSRMNFHNDFLHGEKVIFSEVGSVLEKLNYCEGLLCGITQIYSSHGKLLAEESFENGLLIKAEYYKDGNLLLDSLENGHGIRLIFEHDKCVEKQTFVDGIQLGEIQYFNEKGHLIRTAHYKNGMLHGNDLHFFVPQVGNQSIPPKIKAKIQWHYDQMQGLVETWNEEGILQTSYTILDGKREGRLTVYYSQGNVAMLEEYEKGVLRKGLYFNLSDAFPVSKVEEGNGIATIFDENGVLKQRIPYREGVPYLEETLRKLDTP